MDKATELANQIQAEIRKMYSEEYLGILNVPQKLNYLLGRFESAWSHKNRILRNIQRGG